MHIRHVWVVVIVAGLLSLGIGGGLAVGAISQQTHSQSGGAIEAVRITSSSASGTIRAAEYTPIASLTIEVPRGHTDLLLARFSTEADYQGFAALQVQVWLDGQGMLPDTTGQNTFQGRPGGLFAHCIDRFQCAPGGTDGQTHTVTVVAKATRGTFTYRNWVLTVMRAHGCPPAEAG